MINADLNNQVDSLNAKLDVLDVKIDGFENSTPIIQNTINTIVKSFGTSRLYKLDDNPSC